MSEAPKKIIVKNADHPDSTYYIREDIVIELEDFIQEVRKTGDTRLASMAIIALAKLEKINE